MTNSNLLTKIVDNHDDCEILSDVLASQELNVLLLSKLDELDTATGDAQEALENDIEDINYALDC